MEPLRRIAKNAAALLSGQAAAAILQLAALAITARALGPEVYGTLVLIQAWIAVVDRLLNFQSWQMLIRYGAGALEKKDDLRSIAKLALLLDAIGAIGGAIIAMLAIAIGAEIFDWSSDITNLGIAYSIVILFHFQGMATGVLRLFDRFGWFAIQATIAGAIRLTLVLFAYLTGAGLWTFALAWAAADIASNITLFILGWIALGRAGHPLLGGSLREARDKNPGILRFALLTNLETSLRHAFREADVFIVRAFLDTAAVGQYQLVKQIASVPERLTNPLYFSALPAMAGLWAKQDLDAIRSLIRSSSRIGGALALLLLIGWLSIGVPAIGLTAGAEYRAVYLPAAIALIGTCLWPATFAWSTLRLAMGLADEKLRWTIWISIAGLALQAVLLPAFGLIGAASAYAITSGLMVAASAIMVRDRLPKSR